MPRPAMRPTAYVRRCAARTAAGVLLAAAALSGAVVAPAQAAGRVTVDAGGEGAVIDSTYSTELTVRGSGFQSVKGGHGGIYVWFGTVKGRWKPSQGGKSGDNYVYVPDSETKDNAGFQRYVAFPGSSTADAANGGTMRADGSWNVKLLVPGPTFQGVGRNGSVTRVDCRKVTCGVITIGAHGVQNGNNETFTPVRLGDLGGTGATEQEDTGGGTETGGSEPAAAPAPTTVPSGSPVRKAAGPQGPAALSVDHTSAISGRAMSFTASGLVAGEQFTAVLDDGLAAAGPFVVGQDGRASGVISLPATLGAGTHELRLFGSSKDVSLKFGVQEDPEVTAVSAEADEPREEVAAWVFAGVAGAIFLGALAFAVRRAGGRRARA